MECVAEADCMPSTFRHGWTSHPRHPKGFSLANRCNQRAFFLDAFFPAVDGGSALGGGAEGDVVVLCGGEAVDVVEGRLADNEAVVVEPHHQLLRCGTVG